MQSGDSSQRGLQPYLCPSLNRQDEAGIRMSRAPAHLIAVAQAGAEKARVVAEVHAGGRAAVAPAAGMHALHPLQVQAVLLRPHHTSLMSVAAQGPSPVMFDNVAGTRCDKSFTSFQRVYCMTTASMQSSNLTQSSDGRRRAQ